LTNHQKGTSLEILFITGYCIVEGNRVIKDGETIFENKNAGLTEFLESAYRHTAINYPKFYKMDNLSKLGFLASEYLLKDSFMRDRYLDEEVSVVLSNASSSLDTDLKYYQTIREFPSPALFVYTLPNIVIGEICIRNRFKGENAFFVFNSFDATFIAGYVTDLFRNQGLRACVCGWVELLEGEYQAVLFLVEKEVTGSPQVFTAESLKKIYPKDNG
jgi:hypothetical protein